MKAAIASLLVAAIPALASHAAAPPVSSEVELFRGPDGQQRFFLPQSFQVKGEQSPGVRLGIYSLTHEDDLGTQGLENGVVLQGGFLTFPVTTVRSAPQASQKPVPIRWKAVEWSAGLATGVVPTQGESAFPHSWVSVSLSREDVDILRRQSKSDATTRAFSVKAHFIMRDYEELAPSGSAFHCKADAAKVHDALRQWGSDNPGTSSKFFDAAGSSASDTATDSVLLSESGKFIQFCLEQGALSLEPKPQGALPSALAAAVYAMVRIAWLDYRLGKVANILGAEPSAVWRTGKKIEEEPLLEGELSGWVEVERYVRRDVDVTQAKWTESVIAVDGFKRETKQRLHFTWLDDWAPTGLDRLALEVVLSDPDSGYELKKSFSIDLKSPGQLFTCELKGRYSDQLRAKWRIALGMLKNGKAIPPTRADLWNESRIPNFDAFFQLDAAEAAVALAVQSDPDPKKLEDTPSEKEARGK